MGKNEQDVIEVPEENLEGLSDDTDWKVKAAEIQKKHIEAGIKQRERTKVLKEQMTALEARVTAQKPPEKLEVKELTDWNDSQKSLLIALKVDPQDFDFVKEEAKKFSGSLNGADLITLSNNQYFANKLEARVTERANAKAAAGGGSGGRSGTGGEESVEHWMGKLSPTEGIPAHLPRELREKIVDARMQKGTYQKEFYNS